MRKPPTRQDFEAELIRLAHEDDAFRNELFANPAPVIRKALHAQGIDLADAVAIHLHQETPSLLHHVISANDKAFRAKSRVSPWAMVRRELMALGTTKSEGVAVQMHRETPTELHFVLPAPPPEKPSPARPISEREAFWATTA